jgi:hypothetical protein
MEKLSKETMLLIQESLSTELVKRGFHAPITVEQKGSRVEVTSSPFQTIPVLFKELTVGSFNSVVQEHEELYTIDISITVFYKMFDGGNNGVKLFHFHAKTYKESNFLIEIQIS